MKEEKIVCDVCSEEFGMSDVEVLEEKLKDDRVGMFFRCPACETKFPFAGITNYGILLRGRLKKIVKKIEALDEDSEEREELIKNHSTILQEYSKEVTGPYKEEDVE